MFKLDRKDREILYQLDLDSRQSNAQIAKKVRLSKEVVAYRIERLQRNGIIEGFYVLADMTKFGYLNARIFLKLKDIGPDEEKRLVDFFIAHDSFWWVDGISGAFTDLGLACWVKGIEDFSELKESLLNKYRHNLEFYRDSFYSKLHFWSRSYLTGRDEKRKYAVIPGDSKPIKFDNHDLRLMAALSQNARISLLDLAVKTGLSVGATKNRLENLKKSGAILGFRPKINLGKIGYYWYKVELQLEENTAKNAMLAYFSSHPNIIYAYESIGGGTDLELEMEVESYEKFREVIDGIRKKFRNELRTYVYYLWSAEHKIVFFPRLEFFK